MIVVHGKCYVQCRTVHRLQEGISKRMDMVCILASPDELAEWRAMCSTRRRYSPFGRDFGIGKLTWDRPSVGHLIAPLEKVGPTSWI